MPYKRRFHSSPLQPSEVIEQFQKRVKGQGTGKLASNHDIFAKGAIFDKLSQEMMDEIPQYLDNLTDLLAAALLDRRFRDAVRKKLFYHIHLELPLQQKPLRFPQLKQML
jgi:hypothetical protein